MSAKEELSRAIGNRDAEAANRILDQNPGLATEKSESGVSFVLQALYSGSKDIVRSLAARGGVMSAADAVANDDVELLASYLADDPAAASEYTPDGWTPLHLAAHFGNEAAVTTLVSQGADVNAWSKNDVHNQPLHAACSGDASVDIVGTLLSAGAQLDAVEAGGLTPLHLAAANGNVPAVELLISRGANRTLKSDDGKTAGDLAAAKGYREVGEMLSSLQVNAHLAQ